MNGEEQEFIRVLLTETTEVDFSSINYEITQETHEDVQRLYRELGLEVPSRGQIQTSPTQVLNDIRLSMLTSGSESEPNTQ